jgi:hypothetical protein
MTRMIIGALIGSILTAFACWMRLEDWQHDTLLMLASSLPECADNTGCPDRLQDAYQLISRCRHEW